MSYINLSVQDKGNRVSQISTDIGSSGYLVIYSGGYPLSPDITVSAGNLLCALPCAVPFGTLSRSVQNASVNTGGTGGTDGTQTVTDASGHGAVSFQASVTISGGVMTAVNSITVAGFYSGGHGQPQAPLNGCPVTGAGLSGATLNLAMTSTLTAGTITQTNATATGTAGFARLATSNTAGAAGIVDLDVGTSGTSVIINTTSIVSGNPIIVSSCTISEA